MSANSWAGIVCIASIPFIYIGAHMASERLTPRERSGVIIAAIWFAILIFNSAGARS